MERYIPGSGLEGGPTFSLGSQFEELELIGTVMQYKELGRRVIDRIGIGGSILSRPVIYRNKVFFGCCDKNFYCLDAQTGKEVWRFPTNDIIYNNLGADFSENTVFFCSMDKCLYAADIQSGEMLWRFETGGPIIADPKVYQGRVYFSSGDGIFYCLNADEARLIWQSSLKTETGVPALYKERIYTGGLNGVLFCLDMSGRVLWKFHSNGEIALHPPLVSENRIYFGSFDKNVYCLDINGGLVWKFECADLAYSPTKHKGRLYFGSRDFCAYCLDASNGKLLWKFRTGGFVVNPSIWNGRIYFGSWDNNIYCVDENTGKLVWKFPTQGFVTNTTASEGKVYAGSWDCNMYCLDAETGKLIWKFKTSLGTPSQIEPPETGIIRSAEIVWSPEPETEKDKYKSGADLGEYSINLSQYAVRSEYTQQSPYKTRKKEF
ncbi:MAG: PQQ-binding-like beta-propeller repeat protein [Candidatus Aenigmarchaeota archaeon]|nr:PQQ-binding-like beta-propeller repeat protein [Candidatus Aenigmarchaeota archaeon]